MRLSHQVSTWITGENRSIPCKCRDFPPLHVSMGYPDLAFFSLQQNSRKYTNDYPPPSCYKFQITAILLQVSDMLPLVPRLLPCSCFELKNRDNFTPLRLLYFTYKRARESVYRLSEDVRRQSAHAHKCLSEYLINYEENNCVRYSYQC